jgi:hypothetical protein
MYHDTFSRRRFLKSTSSGFGFMAFAGLSTWAAEAENPLAPKPPHFASKAKRVVFLCMRGGPSHVDTFDHKPLLTKDAGKASPQARFGSAKLYKSPFDFKQHGQSGLWISSLFPEVAKHADKLCLLRGMETDLPNHPQAFVQMHTGNFQFVRPSLGAWTLYGLGTGNANLPGFITLNPPVQVGGAQNYGSAFLPAIYQGTPIRTGRGQFERLRRAYEGKGTQEGVGNIGNERLDKTAQRHQLDFIQSLNRERLKRDVENPQVEGMIQSYELAFRMQDEIPRLMDIDTEPESIKNLYGIGDATRDAFGRQCLLARRFAEAGVRFIEVAHGGNWDQHFNLTDQLEKNCAETDGPIAALLTDLAERDMLKDTLVIWGGEFGRTPHAQTGDGRDHNNKGFTMWMAGGGVKGGFSYGETDDYGYEAVVNKMPIHDWHATILHLLGLDHEKLTYRYAGRDFRLTDVYGSVAKDIIG